MQIKEIFQSIQGEGSRVGLECTFIRTVGCNLACDFCDTDFSGSGFKLQDFSYKTKWIWLTGGEPLLQPDVKEVVEKLQSNGHKIAVETNGTLPLPCKFDHVCLSPKIKNPKVTECDDLKVIVPSYNPDDFEHIKAKNYFVQIEHGTALPKTIPLGWRISIQHHKLWGVK